MLSVECWVLGVDEVILHPFMQFINTQHPTPNTQHSTPITKQRTNEEKSDRYCYHGLLKESCRFRANHEAI